MRASPNENEQRFCSQLGAVLALCMGILVLPGCSRGPRVEFVEGSVTLDGNPVDGATIAFVPASGGLPASGMTDADGLYRLTARQGPPLKGTAEGKYMVSIAKYQDPYEGLPPVTNDPAAAAIRDAEAERRKELPLVFIVPKGYTDVNSSGLEATVNKGRNRIDFDLTSDFKAAPAK